MNSGIYTITNKTNGHRYIGSSVDLDKRFRIHRRELRNEIHHNIPLQRAWNKYGEGAFLFEVLEEWEPEFLISMEQWWMNMLAPEYNICQVAGNCMGVKFGPLSKEHKAKLRVANKGKKHSKETRAKMSVAQKGRTISKEHRAKLSKANMGHEVSEETRAKLKGYKHSKESRAKISAAKKGRKLSDEHKAKIGISVKAYWATRMAR